MSEPLHLHPLEDGSLGTLKNYIDEKLAKIPNHTARLHEDYEREFGEPCLVCQPTETPE